MNDRDPRIGVALYSILTDEAWMALDDEGKANARDTLVTGISYSPKRRTYQVSVRTPDGRGVTAHLAASHVLEEPL